MEEEHIYKSRQALQQSEAAVSEDMGTALARARQRAIAVAQKKQHGMHLGAGFLSWRLWPKQAWGIGTTFASLAAVLIGLNLAEQANIDQNLNRLAAIDQKMISGPLPVQAYIDPGFLVFQEASLEQHSADGTTPLPLSFLQRAAEMRSVWSAETLFPGYIATQQGPSWAKLTASQREALAPLESLWGDFEAHRKQKWIRIADRFHMLSPEQRLLAQARMQEWVSMPAIDRRQARAVFDGVKEIIPEDVRIMKWNEYQKLSAKERARLMALAQQQIAAAPSSSGDAASAPDPATSPRSALSKHSDKPLAAQ